MANFEVKIEKIFISPHPNADALEIGNIGDPNGWQVVCRKGLYQSGDLVAYIGENAVVPEWVLKQYGFWNEEKGKGLLAGSKGDRVKMVKLRGIPSLGICLPVNRSDNSNASQVNWLKLNGSDLMVFEGDEVSTELGVTKYEPPIPAQLAGEVFNASTLIGVNYDIEDIKKYPHVLVEGEDVQMTVKLHGTNCQVVWFNPNVVGLASHAHIVSNLNLEEWIKVFDGDALIGYVAIGSKGLSAQGLYFKDNAANANNVYLHAVRPHLVDFAKHCQSTGQEVMVVIGEVFGKNIQVDFDYGLTDIQLRAFDVYVGYRGRGHYIHDETLDSFCQKTAITRVPVVYRGPYSYKILDELANAAEDQFECKHIREGVIVKPIEERYDLVLGRVALKHRSIAYMCRKGGTEFS
jgi:RNA ligase (TIGR02306 family)